MIAKSTRIPRTVASKCVSSLAELDGFDVFFITDTPPGFDTMGEALGDLSSVCVELFVVFFIRSDGFVCTAHDCLPTMWLDRNFA